jgi:hypothetical protein
MRPHANLNSIADELLPSASGQQWPKVECSAADNSDDPVVDQEKDILNLRFR